MADERDMHSLSEMRWVHEMDENSNYEISKEDFILECSVFLKKGLNNGTWTYWIAEENGEIIANIYIHRIHKVPKPQKLHAAIGYVTNVHTREQYRNKGIGTKLLNHVIEWARNSGIELLFVWPSQKSVPYYKRTGFTEKNEIMELDLEE
jgi:N-acetylglutamate synthase-like GNAT family acetyltransferase